MSAIIFALFAGATITMQNSLNGLMTPFVGAFGVSLIQFTSHAVLMTSAQLISGNSLSCLKKVPWYYHSSGFLSAVVVGVSGICVMKLGSAATQCCTVAGQIIMSAFLDHFGLLGMTRHSFSRKRVPGIALIVAGVLFIALTGEESSGNLLQIFPLLAVCIGTLSVTSRVLNAAAARYSGTPWGGGMVNSIAIAAVLWVIFFVSSGFHPDFAQFVSFSPVYYLGAFFGTLTCVLTILSYGKGSAFYSTVFMLFGQMAVSLLMDAVVFHALSAGRLVGAAMVAAGVLLDKKLTVKEAEQ